MIKYLPTTNRAIKSENRALYIVRYDLIKIHGVHGFLHGLKNNTRNKKKEKLNLVIKNSSKNFSKSFQP